VCAARFEGNDGEVLHAARVRVLARVLAGLAVLLLVVSSTGPLAGAAAAASDAADVPIRIRMFGDSVMLGARGDLLAAFPGTDTAVDAFENRSLLGTTPVLVAHPDLLGDVVVLDLGYNDMPDGAVFRERIDSMMQALTDVPRVVWLTQSVFQPARAAMNDELRAAADRYPNLDVVDWDAQVAAHPEFVYADGLHLTPPGRAAFAAAVQQRVAAFRESLTAARASATTTPPVEVAGVARVRAEPAAASSTAGPAGPTGPTGRTVAAVAIGGVALVVLAGVVLLRRAQTSALGAEPPVTESAFTAGGSDPSPHRARTPATPHWRAAGTGAPGPRRSP